MWVYAAAGLVAIAMGFAGGWTTRDWKAGNDEAKRLQAENRTALVRAERVDTASAGDEKRKAAIQERTRVVYRDVATFIDRPVFQLTCVDSDGLRAIAAAAGAAPSASEPAPAMPASGSTR